MNARVLLNLSNELGKRDKNARLVEHFIAYLQRVYNFRCGHNEVIVPGLPLVLPLRNTDMHIFIRLVCLYSNTKDVNSKEEGKEQESIHSRTKPDPGYRMGK